MTCEVPRHQDRQKPKIFMECCVNDKSAGKSSDESARDHPNHLKAEFEILNIKCFESSVN